MTSDTFRERKTRAALGFITGILLLGMATFFFAMKDVEFPERNMMPWFLIGSTLGGTFFVIWSIAKFSVRKPTLIVDNSSIAWRKWQNWTRIGWSELTSLELHSSPSNIFPGQTIQRIKVVAHAPDRHIIVSEYYPIQDVLEAIRRHSPSTVAPVVTEHKHAKEMPIDSRAGI